MHNIQNNDITIKLIAKKDLKVGHVLFQKNIKYDFFRYVIYNHATQNFFVQMQICKN